MSGMQFLRLADAKDDSPQTRTLLGLFEKDALVMVEYFKQVTALFQDLIASQQHSMTAYRALGQKLIEFEKWGQSFPLGRDDSILALTLQQFGVALEKMSVMHEVLSRQFTQHLAPLQGFSQVESNNIAQFQQACHQSSEVHDQVLAKYSRLSKKKESETKACIEVTEELHKARRDVLKNTMDRYSNLNQLQYKRSINLLEPFIGAFKDLKQFQTMGDAIHSKDFHDYAGDISASVSSVQSELVKFNNKAIAEATSVEQSSHYYFIPEPTPDMPLKAKPVNKKLNQKGGYLWMRCKSGLSHKWERKYFFTQGSILMSQGKAEIAGSLIIDLERTIVQPAELDDRRFVFQLNDTADVKRLIYLQAISGSEMEEWIYTIRNINTGYTSDSPVTQRLPPSLMPTLPYSSNQQPTPTPVAAPTSVPQQPGKIPHRVKSESQNTKASESQKTKAAPKSVPPTPPPSPLAFLPDTPIQFDMISPGQEPNADVPAGDGQMGPPKRINPFNQSPAQIRDDQLKASIPGFIQMYNVRFLGSMEVSTDTGSEVIMNTIRNIMTARAIHNIFKTTDSNLIVTSQDVRLQDLATQSIKAVIPLKDISFWSSHHENKRWFAFISNAKTEGSDRSPKFTCQVFETDTLAEEICKSLSIAADIAYKAAITQTSQNNSRRVSDPGYSQSSRMGTPAHQTQQSPGHGPYTLPREYPSSRGDQGRPTSTGIQSGFHAAYLQQSQQGSGIQQNHQVSGRGSGPNRQGMGPTSQGLGTNSQGSVPTGHRPMLSSQQLGPSNQGMVPRSQGSGPTTHGQGLGLGPISSAPPTVQGLGTSNPGLPVSNQGNLTSSDRPIAPIRGPTLHQGQVPQPEGVPGVPAQGIKPLPMGLGLLPGERDDTQSSPDGDPGVLRLSGMSLGPPAVANVAKDGPTPDPTSTVIQTNS